MVNNLILIKNTIKALEGKSVWVIVFWEISKMVNNLILIKIHNKSSGQRYISVSCSILGKFHRGWRILKSNGDWTDEEWLKC